MTGRNYSSLKLIIASIGVLLVIGGLATVAVHAADARQSGHWDSRSTFEFLTGPWMDGLLLGHLADWLRRPQFFEILHRPIVLLLDMIPQWLALIGSGGVIVWRALK